jgi:hypothetical protein
MGAQPVGEPSCEFRAGVATITRFSRYARLPVSAGQALTPRRGRMVNGQGFRKASIKGV